MTYTSVDGEPRQVRYLTLLTSMVLIVLLPVFLGPMGRAGQFILQALFMATVIAGVVAITRRRVYLVAALSLALPAVLLTLAIEHYATPNVTVARDIALLLLFAATAINMLHDILTATHVERDTVTGAICVYLFLGLIWALLYSVLLHFDPEAIRFARQDSEVAGPERFSTLLYYSFVTLTTLGYGDIQPVSSTAREAAWVEAVTGQLYLAVLIARLVGQRIVAARSS